MKSVIQSEKICYICGSHNGLQEHHCLSGNPNRKLAEKYGLKIYLCYRCHKALHDKDNNDNNFEKQIKILGQKTFESIYGTREDFIRIFGKSFILDD